MKKKSKHTVKNLLKESSDCFYWRTQWETEAKIQAQDVHCSVVYNSGKSWKMKNPAMGKTSHRELVKWMKEDSHQGCSATTKNGVAGLDLGTDMKRRQQYTVE